MKQVQNIQSSWCAETRTRVIFPAITGKNDMLNVGVTCA